MLNRQLATMVDDCLVPHERCKEEYKLADAMAIKASRAEWMPQAAEPTQETRTGHGQGTDTIPAQQAEARPSTQAQSFKPALPPLESYQQRPATYSNQGYWACDIREAGQAALCDPNEIRKKAV